MGPSAEDSNVDKNSMERFDLIITGLTREQQAIIAKQEKVETAVNSQQVILATLAQQHVQHEQSMRTFAEEMKILKTDQVDLSKTYIAMDSKLKTIWWILAVVGSVVLTVGGATIGHFIH